MADATVIDLEEVRARRTEASGIPLRYAGAELTPEGNHRLTLPSGHVEELPGPVGRALGLQMAELGASR